MFPKLTLRQIALLVTGGYAFFHGMIGWPEVELLCWGETSTATVISTEETEILDRHNARLPARLVVFEFDDQQHQRQEAQQMLVMTERDVDLSPPVIVDYLTGQPRSARLRATRSLWSLWIAGVAAVLFLIACLYPSRTITSDVGEETS